MLQGSIVGVDPCHQRRINPHCCVSNTCAVAVAVAVAVGTGRNCVVRLQHVRHAAVLAAGEVSRVLAALLVECVARLRCAIMLPAALLVVCAT